MENHDESRAAAIFDPAKAKAMAVATLTQTGARLFHHEQLEGRKVHLPVFLGRAPGEDVDTELASFHRILLNVLRSSTFRTESWSFCERSYRLGDDSFESLVGWCWDGDPRWLIIVNLSAAPASGQVRMPWDDMPGTNLSAHRPHHGCRGDPLRGGSSRWSARRTRSFAVAPVHGGADLGEPALELTLTA